MDEKIDRRKMMTNTAAFAGTAAFATTVATKDAAAQNAVQDFYRSGEFTYCDAKFLGKYWSRSPWDAKVFAGQKIRSGHRNTLKNVLKQAIRSGEQQGVRCTFGDANNPAYTYNDAVTLSRYWTRAWNVNPAMSPYDAKLKVALNLPGGNLWVRGELKKARRN